MTSLEYLCPGCFAEKGGQLICPACGYNETAQRPPLLLPYRTVLQGEYCIGRKLGEMGGFSITYLAWKISLEIPVAIKEFLPRDLASRGNDGVTVYPHTDRDQELFAYGIKGFVSEARTLARFDHPNIMRVRHLFEENATAYMVMDYYQGLSLKEYLVAQGGRISETAASAIMMPILDGLRHVHEKGFLHRDVKPSNIYLKQRKIPVLLDFGAARIALGERSRSLSVVLTEGYAPFEQYHRQGQQGRWTDVYGCAATLYHLVTGQAPLAATERMAGADLVSPDRLAEGLSASFSDAVRQALATQPEERTQSIEELQQKLIVGTAPELASPAPSANVGATSPKARLRAAQWLAAAVVIAVSLPGVAWFFMKPSNQPVPKADPAQVGEGQQAAETDPAVTDPAATGPENRSPEGVDNPGRTRTEEPAEVVDLDSDRAPGGGPRVAPRNQIPIATPDHGVARAGQPITIAVLENDADVNLDDKLTVVFVGEPEYGTAVPNSDGTITYTPKEGHEGLDEFTYRVTDGQEEAETTVRVEVLPSNILLAQDDASQTRAGQEVIIPVLWNDQVPAGASPSITRPPGRGTASKNGDGTVTYQPDSDLHQGSDEFTYTVADGTQTATATVAIEVKPRRAFSPTTAPRSGEVRTHRKDGLAYAWIPPAQEGQTGFWIGQTEVMVGAYTKFGEETFRMALQPPGSTEYHPVVNVNWTDAQAFCQWSEGRLPTTSEWEHAARGGLENPMYPWGDDDPSCSREDPNGAAGFTEACDLNGPKQVGSYQVNGYKLYDMAGNASEWCDETPTRNKKVVKGGSFRATHRLKISRRYAADPDRSFGFIGFRCLRETPPKR